MHQARLSSVLEIDVTCEALYEHMDWVFARQVLAGLRTRCGDNVLGESTRTGSAQLGFRSASATSRTSRAACGPHAAAAGLSTATRSTTPETLGLPANAVGRPTPAG